MGVGYGTGILDWDMGLEMELGYGTELWDWDMGLGYGTGIWYWDIRRISNECITGFVSVNTVEFAKVHQSIKYVYL